MNNFLNYYLPAFFVIYLLAVFVLPSWRVYSKTGINPVTFGKSDNAHDYVGLIMKILTGLLSISILIFSISDHLYQYLNPFDYLEQQSIKNIGLVLIHVSTVWIVLAESNMKQSWRIGIDEENNTTLVTNGLFSVSRNPVFLGMIVSTVGIFLIIPNTLTFFIAAASYITIQIQIRLEEHFLEKKHGRSYTDYKRKVKRLI